MDFTIHCFDKLPSTNEYAVSKAESLPEGAVITTLCQTNGRGRLGRKWESGCGGLYMSVVLKPPAGADIRALPLIAGLAASCAVEKVSGLKAMLKWPNDLLVGSKKIAGILTESKLPIHIVCGIGINVNGEGFSPELGGKATSLFIETGRKFSVADVQGVTLGFFGPLYENLCSRGFAGIKNGYLSRCVHVSDGGFIKISNGGERAEEGYFSGITDEGALLLSTGRGIKTILAGDVSLRMA